ncbi:MAG: cation-transporting P-type ATPase [Candidatus Nomurabacteria bacterium]|jgi:Ca2+-transporting ATPase|nr:cation-transporting P-type ATPase [Candidatus Nomurabacteria bacterium]
MEFYQQSPADVLKKLDGRREGLSAGEAARRLKIGGANVLKIRGESLIKKILAPFYNVMIAVLIVAAALSIWRGERIDAAIILAIIFISAAIDWFQQWSTAKILRSLKKKEREPVEVYRDGAASEIPAENLVKGDVIIVREGQKIPADARLLQADNLSVDESVLTGESQSVRKNPAAIRAERPLDERANMLFAGSFVATGAGVAVITATGNSTEFGQIALAAGAHSPEPSPVQRKVDQLIKWVVIGVVILGALAFGLELLRGVRPVEALRFVLAFAVSAVPEGLPVALAVILALGMRRMAAKNALVRNLKAIEDIGLTTVVATDKTGTLTLNKLSVQEVRPVNFNRRAFGLVVAPSLNFTDGRGGDPLDAALADWLRQLKIPLSDPENLVKSLPFDYQLALSGNVWREADHFAIFVKGAPEKVLARCHLVQAKKIAAENQLKNLTGSGQRVIAFAKFTADEAPSGLKNSAKTGGQFLGLIGIADQLRPRVKNAVDAARRAGVNVRMITGDHPGTAFQIARQIDIADDPSEVFDSRQLLNLKPAELTETVLATKVFARVVPEAKQKIVEQLNQTEITAMTGDGVNDVPALARANVGIAMGAGAAIAKDAADMVLLDNNFRSIVVAIKEGRTIIDNIKRMLVYLLATNAGEVLTTLGALAIGLPLPLAAVQILWINLATDTFMVIPLGLESSAPDIMRRPPAKPGASLLTKFKLSRIIWVAAAMALITLVIFAIFLPSGLAAARSAAFVTLIMIQWVGAAGLRGERSMMKLFHSKNRAFWLALLATFILQIVVLSVPDLRGALHIDDLRPAAILAAAAGAVIMGAMIEIHKWIGRSGNYD